MGYDDEVPVRRLLRYPTWAVVGLSANPAAPVEAVAISARGVVPARRGRPSRLRPGAGRRHRHGHGPVSYTHLTLPTIYSV